MVFFVMLWIPLLNAIITGCFGRFIGQRGLSYIITSVFVTSTIVMYILFFQFLKNPIITYVPIYNFITFGLFDIGFELTYDFLAVCMSTVIFSITTVVHVFALEYLSTDPHRIRFICYLSLFTFFMLLLVAAANLIILFIGWEGVGICSYLLISFWYTRIQAIKSALKAVIINKIGDIALLLAISTIIIQCGSTDFDTIITVLTNAHLQITLNWCGITFPSLAVISFLLVVAAFGKSAQILFHSWLPDAMEGPTPVSALLHAATMVTAGVFLLMRFEPLLSRTNLVLPFLCFFGALTAVFAGTLGVFQYDIKKTIAFSTCSQLGLMILACGLARSDLCLYHLFNHAFYKALLFLAAGNIIHASGQQDIRRLTNISHTLPYTNIYFLIGACALVGLPGFSGWFSKTAILNTFFFFLYTNYSTTAIWFFLILTLGSTLLTILYTFSQYIRIFYNTYPNRLLPVVRINSNHQRLHHGEPLALRTHLGLSFLACVSLFGGGLIDSYFTSIETNQHLMFMNAIKVADSGTNWYTLIDELLPAGELALTLIIFASGFIIIGHVITKLRVRVFKTIYLHQVNLLMSVAYRTPFMVFIKRWCFETLLIFKPTQLALRIVFEHYYLILEKGLLDLIHNSSGIIANSRQLVYVSQSGSIILYLQQHIIIFLLTITVVITGLAFTNL